jgi:hypothetical protein
MKYRFRSASGVAGALATLCIAAAALLVNGCGGDEESSLSNLETMNASLADLEGFGDDLAADPVLEVTGSAALEDLFSRVGFGLDQVGRRAGVVPLDFKAAMLAAPARAARPGRSGAAASFPFGTYERDTTSTAEPFPGWVPAAETPADGFIFHFSEDDDFVIGEGSNARHIAGEIRFLHITLQAVGSESVLTGVTWEIQIDPVQIPLVHVPFAAIVDQVTGEYDRVAFGDVDAPNDLTNCYIGRLAFDFLHDVSTADVRTALIAVNTAADPDYVLLLDLNQLNVVEEMPEEITILFGCGRTNDVESPELVIAADISNFRPDPNNVEDVIADVTGSVTHRGRILATFAGSTAEVPVQVDVDGDGDVDGDDTCADIDITFTDTGDTMNICEAFADAIDVAGLPLGRGMAGHFRVGPLRF